MIMLSMQYSPPVYHKYPQAMLCPTWNLYALLSVQIKILQIPAQGPRSRSFSPQQGKKPGSKYLWISWRKHCNLLIDSRRCLSVNWVTAGSKLLRLSWIFLHSPAFQTRLIKYLQEGCRTRHHTKLVDWLSSKL